MSSTTDHIEESEDFQTIPIKDLENRVKIIKLLQIIGYIDTPFQEGDDYSIHNPYFGNITNILVKDNKITLICLRPGLVIGKGGRNFNYIKQQIEFELNETMDFDIVEDRFWNVY